VVESVLVINPGYLSKRRAAGTYARLIVYAPSIPEDQRNAGVMISHRLFDRARVEVLRI
jgi:DNA polymerase alpha subunit B